MKCSKCGFEKHPSILVKITDNNGEAIYCPNCLLLHQLEGILKLKNNPNFIDDITGKKGAVKYEAEGESYTLEKETMERLILCNLTPEEYFALAEKYSPHNFCLHDDFYDPIDGCAIQPHGVDD